MTGAQSGLGRIPGTWMRKHWVDYICLALFIGILFVCARTWYNLAELHEKTIAVVKLMQGGGELDDVFQDMIGFRRLCSGRNPYPPISQAVDELPKDSFSNKDYLSKWWKEPERVSAHPPTAFLFAAPVAFLSPSAAGVVWTALCLLLIYLTFLCYGSKPLIAVGLSLLSILLLLPVARAFIQITLIWTAGIALAYRYRTTRCFWSGVGIGVASLTKWLPIGIVGYFIFQRKWRAVVGTLCVWLPAVITVTLLYPAAFTAYLNVNRAESWYNILRIDNISLFTQAHAHFKTTGVVLVAIYILLLAWHNRKALFSPSQTPEYSFFLYNYLAVVLLPICWVSSLLPLVPCLGYFVIKGRLSHIIIAGVCLAGLGLYDITFVSLFVAHIPRGTNVLLLTSVLFLIKPPSEACPIVTAGEGAS